MSTRPVTRVDFHCHSTCSDGFYAPANVAERLSEVGVRYAALTDHDTTEGLAEFEEAARRLGISCVTGVEISVGEDRDFMHVLAYGVDPEDEALQDLMAANRARHGQGPVPHGTPLAGAPGFAPREEGEGEGAYGGRPWLRALADVVRVIHEAHGRAFLAHPLSLTRDPEELDVLLGLCREVGLDGIEALYAGYSDVERQTLAYLAKNRGLLVCAGSDYHGPQRPGPVKPGMDMTVRQWKRFRDAVLSGERRPRAGAGLEASAGPRHSQPLQLGEFALRILFPALFAIGLFVISIFAMIVPAFESHLMERKRETIRELTNSAWSILAEYERLEADGVLGRAEAQQHASERIRGMRYGGQAKDYFWITDTQPRMVMHPYRPELEGQDLSGFEDPRGVRLFVEFARLVAESGEGYASYVWQWKDDAERLAPKESYVRGFAPWGWIIGTGIYVQDVNAEIRQLTSQVVNVSAIISVIIVLLLVYIMHQSLRIERQRREVVEALEESHQKYRALVEAATEGTVMVLNEKCTYSNATAQQMLGYSAEEFALLDVHDLLPDEGQIVVDLAAGRETATPQEARLRAKGGQLVDVVLTATRVEFAGKKGLILNAKDIRGTKQMEEALDLSREKYRALAEADRDNLIAELQSSLLFLNEPIHHFGSELKSCAMNDPIERVAAQMTRESCSAIAVRNEGGDVVGIVTDHDFRERVLVNRLEPRRPVFEIMSAPVLSVPHRALVYEAILMMQERGVRHLAVRDEAGRVLSLLRSKDLMRFERYSAAVLAAEIDKALSVDEIAIAQRRLPVLVQALVEGGTRPRSVNRIITTITDTIVERLVALAIEELGPPPARFAFIALGSEGRGEQTLVTDQDNALIYEDGREDGSPEEAEQRAGYFLALATRVCDGLDAAGYHYCRGELMAKNPKWCQPLRVWQGYFTDWVATADPQDMMEINQFFDFRGVFGDHELVDALRAHTRRAFHGQEPFFHHFAENALLTRPPLTSFGRIALAGDGSKPKTFNIKDAMMLVVTFARLYALRHDVVETNTVDRLDRLRDQNVISRTMHSEIVHGYQYLMRMRLGHQARQLAGGREPDNLIDPRGATHIEESTLKQILSQIAGAQNKIANDFSIRS